MSVDWKGWSHVSEKEKQKEVIIKQSKHTLDFEDKAKSIYEIEEKSEKREQNRK